MPNHDVADDALKHNDPAGSGIAEVRLKQEAEQVSRQPLYSTRGVREITKDFLDASKRLPAGELVKDEFFTLFEAVGALEIMDPKMDSGYVPPGDSFEPGFDVCGSLADAEALWIMDELLRLETNFHDGYPLSQNIFTSLHVMRLIHPDNKPPYLFRFDQSTPDKHAPLTQGLVHIVLRAYCIAVIKSVQVILDAIQSFTYYEEEDFITYLFGRDLLPSLETEQSLELILEAIDYVEKSSLTAEMKHAIVQRLALREYLLLGLDNGGIEVWEKIKAEIHDMDQPHALVKAVPDAFSNKVQRQLATSTPPRPMPDLTWQAACAKWLQLCDGMLAIYDLTSPQIRESPYCLQRATWTFAYRCPPPTTFVRAKMQEALTSYGYVPNDVAYFDFMLADIRDIVLAGDPLADPASFQVEVPTDPRHRASRLIEDFLQKASGEYLNLFRMVCQNRCRMRRTFTQAIPLLDELEIEAQEADRQLNTIITPRRVKDKLGIWLQLDPLTLWVKHHKLQIMGWIIQLGFETDLYLPREISDMYLTLREVASIQHDQLLHIQQFIDERCHYLGSSSEAEYRAKSKESAEFVRSLALQSAVVICLSDALSNLYSLLERHSIIDTSSKFYEDDQLRYEARMKPFLGLSSDSIPDLAFFNSRKKQQGVTFSDLCSAVDSATKQAASYVANLKSMGPGAAKYTGIEHRWKQEIKSLETVCVAISAATSQLRRHVSSAKDLQIGECSPLRHIVDVTIPAPGSRYHDWWVVPQFKAKQ